MCFLCSGKIPFSELKNDGVHMRNVRTELVTVKLGVALSAPDFLAVRNFEHWTPNYVFTFKMNRKVSESSKIIETE